MDGAQQSSQLRSVKEALRPVTPIKRQSPQKRQSSQECQSPQRKRPTIAACPICQIKMSTMILPSHADRCKPRRIRPSKPVPDPPSLHFFFNAPQIVTTFSQSPPTKSSHTFTATINLRSTPPTILHLYATTPPPHPIPALPKHSPAERLPLSLLKSALQKSVRRNRPWPALRIALVLLRRRATFELIRRLTIIILEDAILHPAYTSLVFLLAASTKEHVLSYAEIVHLLHVVYQVAAVTWSDPLPDIPNEGDNSEEHQVDIVKAIRVRAAYGGMQCDTQLLRRAAEAWHARSRTPNWNSRFHVYDMDSCANEVTPERVSSWLRPDDPVLRPGDIPLEAWDFHCCSVADDVVSDITKGRLMGMVPRFEKLSRARDVTGVFKGLMWRFWSGVSHKKPVRALRNGLEEREDRQPEHHAVFNVAPKLVVNAQTEEECVWKEELCTPVMEWCKTYRKRYGL